MELTIRRKKLLFSVFAFIVVVTGIAVIFGYRSARQTDTSASGASKISPEEVLSRNLAVRDFNGRIVEIAAFSLTIEVDSDDSSSEREDAAETFVFGLGTETSVVRLNPVDQERYRSEMDSYRDRLDREPGYRIMPPTPYSTESLSVGNLEVGQTVSVHVDAGSRASEIILRPAIDN